MWISPLICETDTNDVNALIFVEGATSFVHTTLNAKKCYAKKKSTLKVRFNFKTYAICLHN